MAADLFSSFASLRSDPDLLRPRSLYRRWKIAAVVGTAMAAASPAFASVSHATVAGTDAIFLAGRTDVTIAPPGNAPAGYPLVRNNPVGPVAETFPQLFNAVPSEAFQFASTGTVNYNTVLNNVIYPAEGAAPSLATLNSAGGISGYNGPVGGLVGVFLDGTNPASLTPPATLNFSTTASRSFTTLTPGLDQVFFIGDGLTGSGTGTTQSFVAPLGATRMYIGVVDGRSFTGAPGGYDDNGGALSVTVTASDVPEPASLALLGVGMIALTMRRRRCF